ncbi:uncharacterized protein LOC143152163 isoform X2 [Ptiloglossa arizonensis]|uniref:uncharacterized protein LOC143152163 isoform X2 n=1 Tax=Ptiloglossa arizonensis TaxID=3350558 RepID=UPI003F9F49BB
MKTELLLQFTLALTILLVTSSEGFFFEYPKKVLMNFLQSLKEKKEAKKRPTHIQHYHVHYYPVHMLIEPPIKAPKKHELEESHNEHLATLGWSDHEYTHVPEPKIKIPLRLFNSWDDSAPWNHEIFEAGLSETVDHSENEDILVEVPHNQKVIIENDHPHDSKKSKSSLLAAFFHKLGSKSYVYK